MPRLSRQTKEIIKTVVVLLIIVALIVFFVILPMGQVKVAFSRSDFNDDNPDSILVNDASAYINVGLYPDTFSVEVDGRTTLACLYVNAPTDSAPQAKGTVCLLHEERSDRVAMLPLAKLFHDSGYTVVVYDQRASGRSTGKYFSDGQLEAADLQEVIRYLDFRGRIVHPLVVVGGRLGADAALLAAQSGERINAVVAMNPYLTTERMLDELSKQHTFTWTPFSHTVIWWWFGIRSSNAVIYRDITNISSVGCLTLLMASEDQLDSPEVQTIQTASDPASLALQPAPANDSTLYVVVFQYINSL